MQEGCVSFSPLLWATDLLRFGDTFHYRFRGENPANFYEITKNETLKKSPMNITIFCVHILRPRRGRTRRAFFLLYSKWPSFTTMEFYFSLTKFTPNSCLTRAILVNDEMNWLIFPYHLTLNYRIIPLIY